MERSFCNSTGIGHTSGAGLRLFPNPCKGKFTIAFDRVDIKDKVLVRISNAAGQTMLHREWRLDRGASNINVDMANAGSGVYFVRIQSGSEITTRRLTVE